MTSAKSVAEPDNGLDKTAPAYPGNPVNPPKERHGLRRRKELVGRVRRNPKILVVAIVVILAAIVGGLAYWQNEQSRIYVEKSVISAPVISLGPASAGILDHLAVKEGDKVTKGKTVAYMADGSEIKSGVSGIVVSVQNVPGQVVSPQVAVVKVIDTRELRVVGSVEEDKGLADIRPGQKVVFTVDAFGSKEYAGVVDSISPTSRQSDIVFSISDKREVRQFDVKVRYDVLAYPELKNGMSAKMWIYKQ